MNKYIAIGNLVKDPELRRTNSGKAVASFTIAINEGKDRTEFVDCIAWEKQAENLAKYCGKGSKIAIEAKYSKNSYEKDGQKRYKVEMVAFNIEYLTTKEQGKSLEQKADDYFDNLPDVEFDESQLPF